MTTKKHRTQRKHTRRPGKTASAPAVQFVVEWVRGVGEEDEQ